MKSIFKSKSFKNIKYQKSNVSTKSSKNNLISYETSFKDNIYHKNKYLNINNSIQKYKDLIFDIESNSSIFKSNYKFNLSDSISNIKSLCGNPNANLETMKIIIQLLNNPNYNKEYIINQIKSLAHTLFKQNLDLVRLLLKHNIDILNCGFKKDKYGYTPFHYLCNNKEDDYKLCYLFIKRYPNYNIINMTTYLDKLNKIEITPLKIAEKAYNTKIINLLKNLGAKSFNNIIKTLISWKYNKIIYN